MENLSTGNVMGGGKAQVTINELDVSKGQMVAFTEGRLFLPNDLPVNHIVL
jgi:hypothetical protein